MARSDFIWKTRVTTPNGPAIVALSLIAAGPHLATVLARSLPRWPDRCNTVGARVHAILSCTPQAGGNQKGAILCSTDRSGAVPALGCESVGGTVVNTKCCKYRPSRCRFHPHLEAVPNQRVVYRQQRLVPTMRHSCDSNPAAIFSFSQRRWEWKRASSQPSSSAVACTERNSQLFDQASTRQKDEQPIGSHPAPRAWDSIPMSTLRFIPQ